MDMFTDPAQLRAALRLEIDSAFTTAEIAAARVADRILRLERAINATIQLPVR